MRRGKENQQECTHFLGLFFSSLQSDGQKSQYSSTNQLLSEEWRVPHLFRYFCVILGLLQ